jgi:hypothetical protein
MRYVARMPDSTPSQHLTGLAVLLVMLWTGLVGTPVLDFVGGGSADDEGGGEASPQDGPLFAVLHTLNRELRLPLVAKVGWPQKVFRIRQSWHLYRDGPSMVRRMEVRVDGELLYRSEDPDHRWQTARLDNRRVRPMVETTAMKAKARNAAGLTRYIRDLARADHPDAQAVEIVFTSGRFPGVNAKAHHGWVARAPDWKLEATR